ncbi:hypothetical protein Y032_0098g3129 [Ancylostoma ceylanicum]|uniref:Uncharacterized protein n=1 Tax=Ancylostoma ceylanicum TaxID=53326 RepID=A0A016TJB9_9BILA|nr:hypothetical protein Y032_0098g3129 [Ancylostoma ceylanicum]
MVQSRNQPIFLRRTVRDAGEATPNNHRTHPRRVDVAAHQSAEITVMIDASCTNSGFIGNSICPHQCEIAGIATRLYR